MTTHEPADEAYGRVSDAKRFERLWIDAGRVLEELVSRYEVYRQEGVDLDPDLVARLSAGDVTQVVRLTPVTGNGGPLTFAWTAFPGILARFGRWTTEAFPDCGCDACDENVDHLADQLRRHAHALAMGEFTETLHLTPRPSLTFSFGPGESNSIGFHPAAAPLGPPGTIRWPAWPTA